MTRTSDIDEPELSNDLIEKMIREIIDVHLSAAQRGAALEWLERRATLYCISVELGLVPEEMVSRLPKVRRVVGRSAPPKKAKAKAEPNTGATKRHRHAKSHLRGALAAKRRLRTGRRSSLSK